MPTNIAISRDELKTLITDAISPLTERLGKVESKIDGLDAHFLPREVADEKISALSDELAAIRAAIKEQREAMFKWLGGAGAIISLIILLAQHISIR